MELVGQGITLLQAHPWIPESFRIAYHLGAAEVAMMRGDQDVYSRFMRLVDAEMAPQTEPALSCMTALIQAKALQTAGRYAEAHQLLQTTDGRELPAAWLLRTRAEILLLELQAQMGKPHKVLPQLELLAHGNKVATSGVSLALARAHLAAGDCDAGNRLLRRIITSHHAPPLPLLIEAMLLTAEVADAQGQETAAVEAATAAVQLASSERILQPLIAAGPRLSGVLEYHPALTRLWPAPLENSTGRWGRELPANPEDKALAEPLTKRELSVLNWLTTTMTMAEIAAELNVSTNTVKTHVAATCRKLEVQKSPRGHRPRPSASPHLKIPGTRADGRHTTGPDSDRHGPQGATARSAMEPPQMPKQHDPGPTHRRQPSADDATTRHGRPWRYTGPRHPFQRATLKDLTHESSGHGCTDS